MSNADQPGPEPLDLEPVSPDGTSRLDSEAPSQAPAPTPPAGPQARFEVEELVARRVVAQGLYLVDDQGLARASVQLENGQAVQTLYDAEGRVRARVGLTPTGSPSVSLTDAGGQIRGQMYLKDNGEARIGMADGAGKLRVKVFLDDGRPSIGLADDQGRPRLVIAESEDGFGVTVRDASGQTVWTSS